MCTNDEFISCEKCALSLHRGFRYFTKEQIELLDYEKICRKYKRGELIYKEGRKVGGIYCISSGIVKRYKTGKDGKEQILRFGKKGDIIGFRSIISQEAACTSARVIEDAYICFIPAKLFLDLLNQNKGFSMYLMRLSCKELNASNKYILDLAQKSIRERVAGALLILHDIFGLDENNYINVSLTRLEIANIVGTASESLIRQLSVLKKEKVIDLKGKKIKLLDIDKLFKISNINKNALQEFNQKCN